MRFYPRRDARRGFHEPQGKYIYDNWSELELWPTHFKNLHGHEAYEANSTTASLKSKKSYEVPCNLHGRCPSANNLLPNFKSMRTRKSHN